MSLNKSTTRPENVEILFYQGIGNSYLLYKQHETNLQHQKFSGTLTEDSGTLFNEYLMAIGAQNINLDIKPSDVLVLFFLFLTYPLF